MYIKFLQLVINMNARFIQGVAISVLSNMFRSQTFSHMFGSRVFSHLFRGREFTHLFRGVVWDSKLRVAVCAVVFLLTAAAGQAVVANSEPFVVRQPDGSVVTLVLVGDEFSNYTVSKSGFTVVFNRESKAWEYASLSSDGELVPTGEVACDDRVARLGQRGLKPLKRAAIPMVEPLLTTRSSAAVSGPRRLLGKRFDYSKFRGLVVLVEYNDCPFSREDIHAVFNDMINKHDYDGYMTTHLLPSKVECPGSVRDYYFENSGGVFDPVFDVVGPVKIDYSMYYARKATGAQSLVTAALRALDSQVDFSKYDTDGNKEVDMVYFVFSGGGSNFGGNDERLIWPHASQVLALSLDGVSFGRYACSTEMYGNPSSGVLDGIGTICHEFSHVLGLPDLYDADGTTNGDCVNPGKWSIMASASYLNKSRTPAGYSLYERYALGFASPKLITEKGAYSLRPLTRDLSPDGYMIRSAMENEFFLIENRERVRWDEFLPGEGMLVHRVDSTLANAWEINRVNSTASHPCYELLRATEKYSSGKLVDHGGDAFPGTGGVTSITNSTSPSMRSWTKMATPLVLTGIGYDDDDKVISFTVVSDDVPSYLEEFSNYDATESGTVDLQGRFTKWNLSKGAVIKRDTVSDRSFLAMVKGSEVMSYSFGSAVENVAMKLVNPTSTKAIFRFYTAPTPESTWTALSSIDGYSNVTVNANSEVEVRYNIVSPGDNCFKLSQVAGSAKDECILGKIEYLVASGTSGVSETVVNESESGPVEWFNLQGIRVSEPQGVPGIWIRRQGSRSDLVVKK